MKRPVPSCGAHAQPSYRGAQEALVESVPMVDSSTVLSAERTRRFPSEMPTCPNRWFDASALKKTRAPRGGSPWCSGPNALAAFDALWKTPFTLKAVSTKLSQYHAYLLSWSRL